MSSSFLRLHALTAGIFCYITGVACSLFPGPPPGYILLAISASLLLLRACRRKQERSLILLLLLFLFIGHYSGTLAWQQPVSETHIRHFLDGGGESVVLGRVERVHGFNGMTSKCDIRAMSLWTSSTAPRPAHGIIRYTTEGYFLQSVTPGATVVVRAELKHPKRYKTPGSFDYPSYLAQHNIYAVGFLDSPLYIQTVQNRTGLLERLRLFPEKWRFHINEAIDKHLDGDRAAIYKALLTGDRRSISSDTIEAFKRSGCLHILAISGIHMSLLGVFLYSVFFWLLRRSTKLIQTINTKKAAFLLCIIPLFLYALIAGLKTPVLRSFLMSLMVIIALCSGRKHSVVSLLSLAALLILIISPTDLGTPSFQLSFSAVAAIALAAPTIARFNSDIHEYFNSKFIARAVGWLLSALLVSVAATAGTAPLLMYHFDRISLVGIVANLLVEPLICLWSLPYGFLAVLLIFLLPPLAAPLLEIGAGGISLALETVSFFANLPSSFTYLPPPEPLQIVLFYVLPALLLIKKRIFPGFKSVVALLTVINIWLMVLPPSPPLLARRTGSTLHFLDVGHGSSTLIELENGRNILIDGGAISSTRFDIGANVIAPFLLARKIRKVGDIVVTHPDGDHYNGLKHIIRYFKPERLWVSTREAGNWRWFELLQMAKESGTTIRRGRAGDVIAEFQEASLRILANTALPQAASASNDNGLVIRFEDGETAALFPGDISSEVERRLLSQGLELEADVLLAVHHGSVTSNSLPFLSAVTPDLMIVSSRQNRRRSFPDDAIVERCRHLGIRLLPIHHLGTVTIQRQGAGFEISTFRSGSRWSAPSSASSPPPDVESALNNEQ